MKWIKGIAEALCLVAMAVFPPAVATPKGHLSWCY